MPWSAQILGTMAAVAIFSSNLHAALADPCAVPAEAGENVTIAGKSGDGHILLADGRRIRLAGVDLASLRLPDLAGTVATLVGSATPDRHGALRGALYLEGRDLVADLTARGLARIRPSAGEEACYTELMTAEDNARRARLGLWAEPGYAVADAATPEAVARHADGFVIVAGRVLHVGVTKTTVWIDFGKIWREDVTLAIPAKQWPRFEATGLTATALEGSYVRARGVVTMRDGPRIEITEPAAIEQVAPVSP
ncbi:thermonuclease family protein [Labrys okinawensis]|nr:thermonuclease family protein [Labrys okinawensis]